MCAWNKIRIWQRNLIQNSMFYVDKAYKDTNLNQVSLVSSIFLSWYESFFFLFCSLKTVIHTKIEKFESKLHIKTIIDLRIAIISIVIVSIVWISFERNTSLFAVIFPSSTILTRAETKNMTNYVNKDIVYILEL